MPRADDSRLGAVIVLILAACAIAFAPVFVRLTGTGPAAAGFWRLLLALPGLALLAGREARTTGRRPAPSPATLLAGLFFALDLGCWHYGLKLTSVANATILANLSPVVVTIGAWLFLKERPSRLFLAGLVMAVAGTWVIALANGGGKGPNPPLGDALSVAASLWYATYMLIVRSARTDQTASQVMLWSSLAGAPLLLAAALLLHETIAPPSLGGWFACAGLGAVHVLGQGAISWALGRIPAATASVILLVQPVLSIILGWAIFAEPLIGLQLAGAVAALGGVLIAQLGSARRS